MRISLDNIYYIIGGIGITLQYALISVFFGLVIGVILSILRMSNIKSFKLLAQFYVSIFRGTPLILQLSIFYYGISGAFNIKIPIFIAGILTFSLNSAAYISEIIRSGINSIDKGQFEAAKSLGISYPTMMKDIILPQALRSVLPSLVNEIVDLLKESSLISVIGEVDIMRRSQIVSIEKYIYFEPLLVAALCYYILVLIMSKLAKIIEHKIKL